MSSPPIPTPWVVCPSPRPQAKLRLFCIPFAGGGASAYRPWAEALSPHIEVCSIQLPGRESRFKETPFKQTKPIVEALATALSSWVTMPFAIFGHSLGALLGFELTRELRRRGNPLPVHLFVSARRAPHLADTDPMHNLSEAEFIQRLRQMDGTPEAVLQEPELMAFLVPILRADVSVNDTYVDSGEPPLDIPMSAFGGLGDGRANKSEIEAWRQHTQKDFAVEFFSGGHFYFKSDAGPVVREVTRTLQPIMANLPNATSR